MAKKDKFTLPAIGKPKSKANKTSATELGKTANKQFKQGYAEKDKKIIDGNKTVKQSAQLTASKIKRGIKLKNNEGADLTRKRYARITGV